MKSNGPWDRDRPSSQRGGPGTSDPDRITFENVPLITVIGKAYGVGDYGRISGPEWSSADQFTFAVKLPAGATKEQLPEMWPRLLEDRFHLAAHHETKELPA